MPRLAHAADPARHDRLFLARYALVRQQALRLTGNAAAAEDLAQDAYVRFVLAQPDLARIDNLDAYLTVMVRNMHLSRIRRANRRPETSFDLLDYDSIELAVSVLDERRCLDARQTLRDACAYGCRRRLSAKTGSVFLLRFFHGLTPGETARVVRASSRTVDDWVRQGRLEVKRYLSDPSRLGLLTPVAAVPADGATSTRRRVPRPGETAMDALVAELHDEIFAHRHARCFTPADWDRLYAADAGSVPGDVLAAIVTCPQCLEEALGRNALPPLSGRSPFDHVGERQPRREPSSTSETLERRARRVHEHRPQSFSVAVNGFVVGREHVCGERSEVTLSVTLNEPIALIELWSDQDVCLLSLPVEPPPAGDAQQIAMASLSDGRSVTLEVSFCDLWPQVRAAYLDPLLATPAMAHGGLDDTDALEASHAAIEPEEAAGPIVPIAPLAPAVPVGRRGLAGRASAWWRRLLAGWRARADAGWGWALPVRVGALAAVLIALVYLVNDSAGPTVTAAELLQRADAGHRAFAVTPGLVFHRVVTLEARGASEPALRSRQRIESWQDGGATGVKATRVYDEGDRLVAGEWIHPDGTRTVYHVGRPPRVETAAAPRVVAPDEMWRWDLSPADFATLAGTRDGITMRRGDDRVTFESASAAGTVASAALTVSASALRPLAQTLVVRVGDGLVEYRFEEAVGERLAAARVPRVRFEPDSAFVAPAPAGVSSAIAPALVPAPAPPAPAPVVDEVALDRWELTATWRLHRLATCMATPGRLERRAGRGLAIVVVAAGEACRGEVANALRELAAQPNIALDVRVVPAAPASEARAPDAIATVTDEDLTRIPLYAQLFDYYARHVARAQGDSADVDAAVRTRVRQLVTWAHDRSTRMRRRAAALHTLNARWSNESLRPLDLDARNMWQQLVREQVHALAEDVRMLRLQLEPALLADLIGDVPQPPSLTTSRDVRPALDRLCELVERTDDQVRTALGTTADARTGPSVDRAALGHALRQIELAADAFGDPWTLEP